MPPHDPRKVDDPRRRAISPPSRRRLTGLEIFMRDDRSPLYRHGIVAKIVAEYIARLEKSFSCWRNRLGFMESSASRAPRAAFRSSRTCSNWRTTAARPSSGWPTSRRPTNCATRWPTSSCATRNFPAALQKHDGRAALSGGRQGRQRLRPVHAGADGQGLGQPEDHAALLSRPLGDVRRQRQPAADLYGDGRGFLRGDDQPAGRRQDGKLNEKVDIPLPVDGLLNPELAHRFDDFTEKNSAYTLSPATIADNLDKDFETLHPKQLRRVVLGPFYSAGITENNSTVTEVLSKVRKPENAWLLTWTIQEVYLQGREARPQGPVVEREGDRRSSTSTPTISKPRARACRATRSTR